VAGLFALSLMLSCFNVGAAPAWPGPASAALQQIPPRLPDGPSGIGPGTFYTDADVVPTLPVCVASSSFAGELGSSVLYHYRRDGQTLMVGYFVYWTTERPWGKNALSYTLLPALFIDAFYSHLFFLFPGPQRIIYGPGDVEGVRIAYERRDNGRWEAVSAVADDVLHNEVALSRDDFVDREGRIVFMIDGWSHQLGGKGASSLSGARKDAFVCFDGGALEPLTADVARLFRLGSPSDPRRARPAWSLVASSGSHG